MAQETNRDDLLRNYLQTGFMVVAAFVIGYLFSQVRYLKSGSNPTPSNQPVVQGNDPTNPAAGPTVTLASIVEAAGANSDDVLNCMNNGEFTEEVEAELSSGGAAGVNGTPGNFIMVGTQGEALPGAVPFEQIKPILDQYISEGKTANTTDLSAVPGVTDDDHVRGNRDAKVTLVEYSDFDCPFCTRFHDTTKQILDAYDGEVRLVFRDFPLAQLHPNAPKIAEASECIAAQNGEEAFWSFVDAYFAAKASGATVTL